MIAVIMKNHLETHTPGVLLRYTLLVVRMVPMTFAIALKRCIQNWTPFWRSPVMPFTFIICFIYMERYSLDNLFEYILYLAVI